MKPLTLRSRLPICLLTVALLAPVAARSNIFWRVSVKMILDEDGEPPSGSLDSRAAVEAEIAFANAVLARSGRGYRMQLIEYAELLGVSQWFANSDGQGLQAAAKADPDTYHWCTNAINVYIHQGNAGGCFCLNGNELILVGGNQGTNLSTILHESGHYFDLRHTHYDDKSYNADGTECTEDDHDHCRGARLAPGDNDYVSDTLPDHHCWDWVDIAANAFPTEFSSGTMTASQTNDVDNVWYNMLSYHDPNRYTPDQLDRMTDTSNGARNYVATGHTRFVDGSVDCEDPSGSSSCTSSSGGPYPTVASGIGAANSGDIVLVRVGTYPEQLTITKAITLRASRGHAIIGR